LRYHFNGRESMVSLGKFPAVSLKEADKRRVAAQEKLDTGIDIGGERRASDAVNKDTFRLAAEDFMKSVEPSLTPGTIARHRQRLEEYVYKDIGNSPIGSITPQDLLKVLRKVEAQGKVDTAKRIRELCSQIWLRAVLEGKAQYDVAAALKGAIKRIPQKSHAAITDPRKLGALMRSIDAYDGHPLTQAALKLSALLFVRPGELRRMEWSEVDLDGAIVRFENLMPAERDRERERASREALGITGDVGRDPRLVTGGEGARTSPSSHHLIRNKKDVVGGADSMKLGENTRRIHAHAAGTENQGLDEESGNRPCSTKFLQGIKGQCLMAWCGKRDDIDRKEEGFVRISKEPAGADTHSARSVAVVGGLHDCNPIT